MSHPVIIQGGMGVAVSNWRLARTVSQLGQLGVVSGTLLSVVMARRLQLGDPGGHITRALRNFPIQSMVERVMKQYFVPGGKPSADSFKPVPMPGVKPSAHWTELTVLASFAEIFLAREGHDQPVGVNLLEKIQVTLLASLYGAMLAGVSYVLIGAGIPRAIPGVLDQFAVGDPAELKIDTEGAAPGEGATSRFEPGRFFDGPAPALTRPTFLPIVSSATLALNLARKSNGRVDGFIIEGDTAGGHNAPPRGPLQLNATGEPIYGPRDIPDLAKFRELGLPFWLAGSYGEHARLVEARAAGAAGIQVGTAFAFCEESGISPELKRRVIAQARGTGAWVHTDPRASPTGFPFKVIQLEGTLSHPEVYQARPRVCDLGYLRSTFLREDGSLGYRCASEPDADYLRKGGDAADLAGRKCLCNGLLATVGLAQQRAAGEPEPPILTAGNDVSHLARYLPPDRDSYTAADVIRTLLG